MSSRVSRSGHGAFTLLELLVVVAIIAVLAAMLLPALARARVRGQSIQCLNNQRQLGLACMLYVDEHGDRMPYNLGEAEIRRLVAAGQVLNWNSSIMSWEVEPDNTNTVRLVQGGLGSYVAGQVRVYRCPADHVVSDIQAKEGWSSRVRSISMNAMVGDAGEFNLGGGNYNNPVYKQFLRISEVPRPAEVFVFIEEHPDSVNDGYFINKFYTRSWMDLPASWHDGAANLTFSDGHAESRRWRNASTRPPGKPEAAHLPFPVSTSETGDYDWLMARTSMRLY